jgi:hypothetical protein
MAEITRHPRTTPQAITHPEPAFSHPKTMASELNRGLWVWNSASVLSSAHHINTLIGGAQDHGISDLYFYMAPSYYQQETDALQNFISGATAVGVRVWALDGDRAYLDDAEGPAIFYSGIENLTAYNLFVPAEARFFGFQSDIEPQDDASHKSFHNDVTDSALSKEPGSGTWQATQAQDREMLMRSWLTIHQTASELLHSQNLHFGAAMPFWTESYFGGEVQVNHPDSGCIRQSVMKHMMPLLDEYVVMSYNTSPDNAAARVAAQAAYASTLPAASRPRVYASIEVAVGVGENVSYGDTAGKNSKSVVMRDMESIIATLKPHSAFKGVALHHWSSWQVMPE